MPTLITDTEALAFKEAVTTVAVSDTTPDLGLADNTTEEDLSTLQAFATVAEVISGTVTLTSSDSFAVAETGSFGVLSTKSDTDTGVVAEAFALAQVESGTDSLGVTEVSALLVTANLTDPVALVEKQQQVVVSDYTIELNFPDATVLVPSATPVTDTDTGAWNDNDTQLLAPDVSPADATLSEAGVLNVLGSDTAGLVDAGESISATVRAPDTAALDDGTTQIVQGNLKTITDTDGFALIFESVVDGVAIAASDSLTVSERAVPGPIAADSLTVVERMVPSFTLRATDQNLLDDRAVLVIESFKGYLIAALSVTPRLRATLIRSPRLAGTLETIPETDATLTVRPP